MLVKLKKEWKKKKSDMNYKVPMGEYTQIKCNKDHQRKIGKPKK